MTHSQYVAQMTAENAPRLQSIDFPEFIFLDSGLRKMRGGKQRGFMIDITPDSNRATTWLTMDQLEPVNVRK